MSVVDILQQELAKLRDNVAEEISRVGIIKQEIDRLSKQESISRLTSDEAFNKIIDGDKFLQFVQKPFVTYRENDRSLLVFVPKCVKGYNIGWLVQENETYNIFRLDQYSAWLGDVPQELLNQINFRREVDGIVEGDTIYFSGNQRENVRQKFKQYISELNETSAKIKRGYVFDVIAGMVENGCLPFRIKEVAVSDMREGKAKFELRDYQKPALDRFIQTGAVGMFYPTGSGKSFFALKAIDILKGRKLIVVPSIILKQQWQYYLETFVPHAVGEVDIVTYQGFKDDSDKQYMLTIYDECQRLPANTFSRLAVIRTKYRIGLSASPHREDGKESYIFALTGFPIGINWPSYMEQVGRICHPIFVHTVRGNSGKIQRIAKILDISKKTLIYCDSIDLGKNIAKEFNIPFVYGQSNNRLETIKDNNIVVVSRVGDVGVSVHNLQRVIEVDFLFGSRQQELQRTGRLMHSDEKDVRHDIIMTEKELEQYGKRLWALTEKGFNIRFES